MGSIASTCAGCGATLKCGADGQAIHPGPCPARRAAPGLFGWQAWDVRTLLPDGWQEKVLAVACGPDVTDHWLLSGSVTSREAGPDVKLLTHVVPGDVLAARLPWLHGLYTGPLTALAQQASTEELSCAADLRYGAVLNVQREGERYELHVDSQPRQGLLYLTSHPEGSGGTLRAANRGDVRGLEAVNADCAEIYPQAGHFVAFDGRRNTHYVDVLGRYLGPRVVLACNWYTASSPESDRPADLNVHLGLSGRHLRRPPGFRQHL